MSDSLRPLTYDEITSAIRYNNLHAHKYFHRIPERVKLEYPNLVLMKSLRGDPPLTTGWFSIRVGEYSKAVIFIHELREFQFAHGLNPDGWMGPKTGEVFDSLQTGQYLVYHGSRIQIPTRYASRDILVFDEPGGYGYKPSKAGNYDKKLIVWHWGSHGNRRLFNFFSNTSNPPVRSHGSVDYTGAIEQWTDLASWNYHAGFVNKESIGFDIAQRVQVEYYDQVRTQFDVEIIQNPTSVGERSVLSLSDKAAASALVLTHATCQVTGIPFRTVNHHRRLTKAEYAQFLADGGGVLGHHHIPDNGGKWDIACWWSSIFKGTSLDILEASP